MTTQSAAAPESIVQQNAATARGILLAAGATFMMGGLALASALYVQSNPKIPSFISYAYATACLLMSAYAFWRMLCAHRLIEPEKDPAVLELVAKARSIPAVNECVREVEALKRPINRGEAKFIAALVKRAQSPAQ